MATHDNKFEGEPPWVPIPRTFWNPKKVSHAEVVTSQQGCHGNQGQYIKKLPGSKFITVIYLEVNSIKLGFKKNAVDKF